MVQTKKDFTAPVAESCKPCTFTEEIIISPPWDGKVEIQVVKRHSGSVLLFTLLVPTLVYDSCQANKAIKSGKKKQTFCITFCLQFAHPAPSQTTPPTPQKRLTSALLWCPWRLSVIQVILKVHMTYLACDFYTGRKRPRLSINTGIKVYTCRTIIVTWISYP